MKTRDTMRTVHVFSLTAAIFFVIFLMQTAVAPIAVNAQDYLNSPSYRGRINTPFYSPIPSVCNQDPIGGNSDSGSNVSSTDKLANFLDKYGQPAYDISRQSGVPYEVILGQAIVESGWGESGLTTSANNFFGIKAGSDWDGEIYRTRTREQQPDGTVYYVTAAFRKYATPLDSFRDHALLLTTSSRYEGAFEHSRDPVRFLEAVWEAGYATDTQYVEIVGAVINSIESYVAENDLWPPAAEMEFEADINELANTGTSSSSSGCDSSVGANGGSVTTVNGLTFPLRATKQLILAGADGSVWCYEATSNCHHNYNAVDIFAEPGTVVIAAKGGTVVSARDSTEHPSAVGSRVVVLGTDDNVYYYAHMGPDTLSVASGQTISAGQELGRLGGRESAVGTPPHLHFDVQPPPASSRPSCSGASCRNYEFIDIQPRMAEIYESLPEN